MMCTDESGSNKSLNYVKTELGGCNTPLILKNTYLDEEDTVLFTAQDDTLDVFVGINYVCCAPFTSEAAVTNDSILITITDMCDADTISCYCHCNCYYTWDFIFTDFENKEYDFKIYLNTPDTEAAIIFKEGVVDLSSR